MKKLIWGAAALLAVTLAGPVWADGHEGRHGKAKMFEKLDSDENGYVTEAEFIDAHKRRFSDIDSDNDGRISKDEARAHHEARRKKMKDRVKERRDARGE